MLITKFDLYKSEWLDLVFDHRNKEYGAYELRQHYGSNMVKSMGIAFAGIGVLIIASIVFKPNRVTIPEIVKDPVILTQVILPTVTPPKPVKADPVKPSVPAKPSPATGFAHPVIVPTEPPVQPPVIADIKGDIGPVTVKGPATVSAGITDDSSHGVPGGTGVADDKTIHGLPGLDVMPEPIGGASAWAKFLQKNLRYPAAAQEEGISGRVILSFVIEKDGSLSNITVDGKAGHGFDEEALRVLKLAKAWSPGKQNGQAVRVKYSIPITFQLADQQ